MTARTLILGADNVVGRQLQAALANTQWAQPVVVTDATLASAIDSASCVVSCTMGQPAAIIESARALFTAANASPNRPRIVHVSSMTVYGAVNGTIKEDAPLHPSLGAYAAARIAAERMAEGYPRVVTLRPGCEYGPQCDAWSTRVAQWLLARRLGDLGAAGDGYCNLLFIDDLVTAIMAAIQQPDIDGQAFNLSTPEVVTWNDYFMRFAKALGATPVRRVTSRRLRCETKLIAPPLKILELAIGAQRAQRWGIPAAIPPSLLTLCSQEIKLDVRKAEHLLGIQFTPVDAGLAATAAWINHPH